MSWSGVVSRGVQESLIRLRGGSFLFGDSVAGIRPIQRSQPLHFNGGKRLRSEPHQDGAKFLIFGHETCTLLRLNPVEGEVYHVQVQTQNPVRPRA